MRTKLRPVTLAAASFFALVLIGATHSTLADDHVVGRIAEPIFLAKEATSAFGNREAYRRFNCKGAYRIVQPSGQLPSWTRSWKYQFSSQCHNFTWV